MTLTTNSDLLSLGNNTLVPDLSSPTKRMFQTYFATKSVPIASNESENKEEENMEIDENASSKKSSVSDGQAGLTSNIAGDGDE